MAENVQETKPPEPPEPPPKPPEMPKPTERPGRAEDASPGRPHESQQSAQQDTRNAAEAEHAKATEGREPDGLRPTPEFQERLDAHTAAKNGPEGLKPTPEFQERLDTHTAERNPPAPHDSSTSPTAEDRPSQDPESRDQRPTAEGDGKATAPADVGDRETQSPAGERAGEYAAAREAAATEKAKADGGTTPRAETYGPESVDDLTPQPEATPFPTDNQQDSPEVPLREASTAEQEPEPAHTDSSEETSTSEDGPPDPPDSGYTGPERRQHEAQHLDPADDLREQPTTSPDENPETDKSAETAARLQELRDEGHGPQRHHDPTDEQLAARMGDPIIDPDTGQPELRDDGHVRAENHIDPMTGTAVDGVHGGVHRCGNYATRIDSADDYVAADRFMRDKFAQQGGAAGVRAPISEVLGPDGHQRLTGYYHDPATPGELRSVDFTGGQIVAFYRRGEHGEVHLRTLYAEPAPFRPNQLSGTE